MSGKEAWKAATKCVQSGYEPGNGDARVLPVFQSTTYRYDSSEAMAALFDLEGVGHMYSRLSNPTVEWVENKIADLEGGVGALCTSSGQAATLFSILNITSSGQNIVSFSNLYGGTVNLFCMSLKQMGIETRFVSPSMSDDEIRNAFDGNTRLLFGETIANPALDVLDFERFARLAHEQGVPLIVDNTFATPVLCRPFEWGADVVVHSTTKYMDGHGAVVGGVVVDSGNFDWSVGGGYPGLTEPDASYHGIVYTEKFGEAAYITKARTHLMRDLGSSPQPMTVFLLNLGLETLHLRMEQHSNNALTVARFLKEHSQVDRVNYPGLEGDKNYPLAQKYLDKGMASGVVSFGVKGGREKAVKFMDSLKLAGLVVHVADARTSVLHPASTTHRQLTDEQLAACGIAPDFVRFSVGIEDPEDIVADLDQALRACKN